MAVRTAQFAIGTTITLIVPAEGDPQQVSIRSGGAGSIFIGAGNVSIGTGYELETDNTVNLTLGGGDELYAVAAAGGQRADVIRSQAN